MEKVLMLVNVVSGILLLGSILLQNKSGGLSSTFGGGGSFYTTRRGLEKVLFLGNWAMVFLFAASALGLALI